MARATRTTKAVPVTEYVVVLTEQEARELNFYLAMRGPGYSSTAAGITSGIYDAIKEALN